MRRRAGQEPEAAIASAIASTPHSVQIVNYVDKERVIPRTDPGFININGLKVVNQRV
jgi:hypothetical protein